eukprot:TRINITY_DN51229_c0_g1_i1.p1 TRINITY_DN51229_c0_g1~~TRINITY_DN51229_c0_g1_i1.p1  ORF type:complete len:449 (+),score=103.57 TRINITY_DN51229_c0_g1_i1:128-1474(+)
MRVLRSLGLLLCFAAGGAEAITSFRFLGLHGQPHQAHEETKRSVPSTVVEEQATLKWWKKYLRIAHAKTHKKTPAEEMRAFLHSADFAEWALFAVAWILLFRLSLYMEQLKCSGWYEHLLAVGVWIAAAAVFLAGTCLNWGSEAGEHWLDGYLMELILSMENIFLYEVILVSFKVPAKMARYALFLVAMWQMVFQMFLFMGVAAFIESWRPLPYLLGAWLIFVAVQTLKDDEHGSFDATTSESYRAFRVFMGAKLLPEYPPEGTVFVFRKDRLHVTMLGPVVCCLLMIMFAMEVDVTLTKIEEIPSHFIAWSSSVLAVFALPELFAVVREMLRRFYLLKTGIGVLLLMFGAMLLLRESMQVSEGFELSMMVTIVIGSLVLSPVLGYSARSSHMYLDNEERQSRSSEEPHSKEDAFESLPASPEHAESEAAPAGAALEGLQGKRRAREA